MRAFLILAPPPPFLWLQPSTAKKSSLVAALHGQAVLASLVTLPLSTASAACPASGRFWPALVVVAVVMAVVVVMVAVAAAVAVVVVGVVVGEIVVVVIVMGLVVVVVVLLLVVVVVLVGRRSSCYSFSCCRSIRNSSSKTSCSPFPVSLGRLQKGRWTSFF